MIILGFILVCRALPGMELASAAQRSEPGSYPGMLIRLCSFAWLCFHANAILSVHHSNWIREDNNMAKYCCVCGRKIGFMDSHAILSVVSQILCKFQIRVERGIYWLGWLLTALVYKVTETQTDVKGGSEQLPFILPFTAVWGFCYSGMRSA